jgi:hypothetical protein
MRRLRARENVSRAPGAPRDPALRVLRPVREELAGRRKVLALRTQARPGAGGEATAEPLKRRDGAPGGERVSQDAHRAGQTSGANCVHLFALGAEGKERLSALHPLACERGKIDDASGARAAGTYRRVRTQRSTSEEVMRCRSGTRQGARCLTSECGCRCRASPARFREHSHRSSPDYSRSAVRR